MRCARLRREVEEQEGFTLVELVVAISLIAMVMLFTAQMFYGGLAALSAAQQRSTFLELSNAEVESVRALPYDAVGVRTNDADYTVQYAGNGSPRTHEGREAVAVGDADFTAAIRALVPAAVSTITTSEVPGVPLPYTVRRWVTWDTVSGGPPRAFKRLQVELEWTENRSSQRKVFLTSLVYPGGQGVPPTNTPPTVAFTYNPSTCISAPETGPPPVAGTVVSFDGSATDPDGDPIVAHTWTFSQGGAPVGQQYTEDVSYTFPNGGTYNVTYEARDSRGGTNSANATVVVRSSTTNTAPSLANATVSPTSGTAPVQVTGTANTFDPDGDPLAFNWNWGDGSPPSTTGSAANTYQAPPPATPNGGPYTVTLTVTEAGCTTQSRTFTVNVVPLTCSVVSGSPFFRNDKNNSTVNDITVTSSNQVSNSNRSVFFEVKTNTACSSLSVRLPVSAASGSTRTFSLSDAGTSNGVRTWQLTDNSGFDGITFVRANGQQASVYTPSTASAPSAYFSFNVHL